jgi:regulator of protease activity HflC (stomatin/prohibitin superfamily)
VACLILPEGMTEEAVCNLSENHLTMSIFSNMRRAMLLVSTGHVPEYFVRRKHMVTFMEWVEIIVVVIVVLIILAMAIKIAAQWQRAVVLRLGRFIGIRGPGLFFIIPFIDRIAYMIDLRVNTSEFKAEKTITKDTVPVDVDAVLFWKVLDPTKAALEVMNYNQAIGWAAQTALREVIGKSELAEILEGRAKLDAELQRVISGRTNQWGVNVDSVEIRDVVIPEGLQNAMSMQAQAERERQARVILGESERLIAGKFREAANIYEKDPQAMHLRAMNMLYEGLKAKENSVIVLVPASVLDTMALGNIMGVTAMAQNSLPRKGQKEKPERYEEEEEEMSTGQR